MDFVFGGCEISLIAAIDFTLINGPQEHPKSLHTVKKSKRSRSPSRKEQVHEGDQEEAGHPRVLRHGRLHTCAWIWSQAASFLQHRVALLRPQRQHLRSRHARRRGHHKRLPALHLTALVPRSVSYGAHNKARTRIGNLRGVHAGAVCVFFDEFSQPALLYSADLYEWHHQRLSNDLRRSQEEHHCPH